PGRLLVVLAQAVHQLVAGGDALGPRQRRHPAVGGGENAGMGCGKSVPGGHHGAVEFMQLVEHGGSTLRVWLLHCTIVTEEDAGRRGRRSLRETCVQRAGRGMNSGSPSIWPKRPSSQSCLACSMRSLELETKIRHKWLHPSKGSPPSNMAFTDVRARTDGRETRSVSTTR